MDDIILKSNGRIWCPLELGERAVLHSRVNLYFKKNSKRRCFSKKTKKKVNGLQPGFAGSLGQPAGSAGSWLFLFFHQFGPVSPPGQPGSGSIRRARPGFKTMKPVGMGLAPFYLLHIFFSTFLSSSISSQEALFFMSTRALLFKRAV